MNCIYEKLGLAGASSLVVVESVSLEPLYSALITLALSVVSVLTVEGVNWLKNWIIKKTKKLDKEEKEKED